jgi:hypothetical protein
MSFVACLLAFAASVNAVIVDRAVIAVGNKVITDSEITRRIRLAAFQNGVRPDLTLAARREAAQRLIDLKLVEREMDLGNYVRTSPAQTAELLKAFTAEHYKSNAEAVRLALAAIGLTPLDFQDELAEQQDLISFTSLRFRPAVEISDAAVEQYYHGHIESTANPASLADSRANIEQILAGEQADLDLDVWLRDQRSRIRIVYLESDLHE